MNPRLLTAVGAYIATIMAANWAITEFGVIPIGLGFMAPAGVLFAGLAFTFRDLTQEAGGVRVAGLAVAVGAAVSWWIGAERVAVSSGLAFAASELADLAVYTAVRRRSLIAAVAVSNVVGLVVDSLVFLWLAFGSLDFLAGQIVGKAYMTALAVLFLLALRRRRAVSRQPVLRGGA